MSVPGNTTPSVPHGTVKRIPGLSALVRQFLALPAWAILTWWFFLFALVRIGLCFAVTQSPVIMPDSALYLHLSHSIASDGALLLRGQPIRYEYILYPLLLSPLHLLPEGVSIFRAIQVFNVLVMHLAVFPAYSLAYAFTKQKNTALQVALLTLAMPDFSIGQHIMAESVAFPLILSTCYLYLAWHDKPSGLGRPVILGGLGFLLYALKPGYVALPGCYMLLLLWDAFRKKDLSRLIKALAILFSLLAFLGLYTLFLRFGLHLNTNQSALYETQSHPFTADHIAQTFNGLIFYSSFLLLAFLFLPLMLPLAHMRNFQDGERRLLQTVLLTAAAIMLGTVYVIYYDEFNGNPFSARVHVRYVAAFLPVLLACIFSPLLKGKRMNTPLALLMIFSLACLIRWDGSALLSGKSYPVDALLLTAATSSETFFNGRLLWPMAAMVFLLLMAYRLIKHGFGTFERRLFCWVLAGAFLLNNVLGYALNQHHNDPVWPADAKEAIHAAGTENTLGVVRDGAFFWTEAAELDVASRCELPIAELDDLIANTAPDGTLQSFVPKSHWQEEAINTFPAARRLIITNEMLGSIVLTEKAAKTAYATSNGCYAVVDVPDGTPWIHSGLSGLNEHWVQPGSRFTLFDTAIRQKGQFILRLNVRAGEGQSQLLLKYGSQEQTFRLDASLAWISATFAITDSSLAAMVSLENQGGNVYVETYLVE